MKSIIALLLLSTSDAHKLIKKSSMDQHIKQKDWSDVAATTNLDDYVGSQSTAMSEVTISNPSNFNLSEEQFKAQEKKYKEEEAAARKEEADREAEKNKPAFEDSLATVHGEMQALKKM
jgi:lysyl-tRNA synthetase class I